MFHEVRKNLRQVTNGDVHLLGDLTRLAPISVVIGDVEHRSYRVVALASECGLHDLQLSTER